MPGRRAIPQEAGRIIVGAGTAGCILASRLARRTSDSVLVLEAGGPYRRILDVPLLGLWASLRNPERYHWEHRTVGQASLDGRDLWFPSGRIVGGSSSVNAMIYSRGHPASYDRWQMTGWSYADLLPYFRRAEDFEDGATEAHGADGPLGVAPGRFRPALANAFLAGCQDVGIPRNDDFNGNSHEGAGFYHKSHRRGRRASVARSYVGEHMTHLRLQIVTGALAHRIVTEAGRAVGVEFEKGGRIHTVRATREVIVCAGAVKSPQLLQLSGIGPADALSHLGIPVLVHRPGVGTNLQDHVRVPLVYRVHRPRVGSPPSLPLEALRYLFRRRGLLTSSVADAAAILPVGDDAPFPDVRTELSWRIAREDAGNLVSLETGLIDPHSHGTVSLRSSDPRDPPRIDPRYLTEPSDSRRIERGMEVARAIANSAPCRQVGFQDEVAPGPAPFSEHLRQHAMTSFHPVGTSRMGPASDALAVVDAALKVHGVERLRVVDASVMPTTVSGNAQAPVVAIAERAADLIISED